MTTDLWCKISVHGLDDDDLEGIVSAVVPGVLDDNTLQADGMEIFFTRNSDADPQRASEFPDGFLFFKHLVEFYVDRPDEELVARLLTTLWAQGIPAVASCDFEESLPQKGGYRSREVPWPD